MRVAVISDVHADLPALKRVLSAIGEAGPDEVWCLGDVVGLGGRHPAAPVAEVRGRCALALGGNHDAWVAGKLALDLLPLPRQRRELEWQRAELSADQLEWLAARPSYSERAGVEAWHGSASDPLTEGIDGLPAAADHFSRQQAAIGLAGHTHRAMAASLGGGEVEWLEPPPASLDLAAAPRWLLNPGAVLGRASWLDLDLGAGVACWRSA